MAENAQGPRTETDSLYSVLNDLLYKSAGSIVLIACGVYLIRIEHQTGYDNLFIDAHASYREAFAIAMPLLAGVSLALGTRIGKKWGSVPGVLIFYIGLELLNGQLGSGLRGFIFGLAISCFGFGRMLDAAGLTRLWE